MSKEEADVQRERRKAGDTNPREQRANNLDLLGGQQLGEKMSLKEKNSFLT